MRAYVFKCHRNEHLFKQHIVYIDNSLPTTAFDGPRLFTGFSQAHNGGASVKREVVKQEGKEIAHLFEYLEILADESLYIFIWAPLKCNN